MHLEEGRVEEMVATATADPAGSITCHSTIGKDEAICRGFYDKHCGPILLLARQIHAVKFVDPPEKEEPNGRS